MKLADEDSFFYYDDDSNEERFFIFIFRWKMKMILKTEVIIEDG
jgi:hypothetical protein